MSSKVQKILIVGNSNTGKTTYVNKLKTGVFEQNSIPTVGANVHCCNIRGIDSQIWDCSGNKDGDCIEMYFINADKAIIFANKADKASLVEMLEWYKSIRSVCFNIPVKFVINKTDIGGMRIGEKMRITKKLRKLCYSEEIIFASVKYGKNLDKIL